METSENKLREYRSAVAAVSEWMESSEELIKGFTVDMDPKDATTLQEKIEVSINKHHQHSKLNFTESSRNSIIKQI